MINGLHHQCFPLLRAKIKTLFLMIKICNKNDSNQNTSTTHQKIYASEQEKYSAVQNGTNCIKFNLENCRVRYIVLMFRVVLVGDGEVVPHHLVLLVMSTPSSRNRSVVPPVFPLQQPLRSTIDPRDNLNNKFTFVVNRVIRKLHPLIEVNILDYINFDDLLALFSVPQ